MQVKLLRAARILHEAGEIVEVSPSELTFLLSTGSCELVEEEKAEEPKPKKTKK